MKKNFLNTSVSLLFAFLSFSGCQKQINDMAETSDLQTASKKGPNDRGENKCRLVNLDLSAGGAGIWQYEYNNKGLAEIWSVDYGYGIIKEKMYYNKYDQIIKADEDYFGSNYVYRFFYNSKVLTRLTRTSVDFPDEIMNFRYTYNNKGQNTRQDDDINDEHVLMYYDALGNCTKTDIYLGSDLWFSDNYTFNAPVKNPWAYVPGVETGFLSYGGAYATNKRLNTSNRTVIYDTDGTPIVYNDYDPSKTIFETGTHNMPTSAIYYDRISESPLAITFNYDNCGKSTGNRVDYQDNHRTITSSPDNIKTQVGRIFHGHRKDIKEKISALRKKIRK